MKLTTGYEFQGYHITEYLDVIFDEMLVGIGFLKGIVSSFDNVISALTGSEATEMINKLNNVKLQLRDRVIEKAESLGANALIGIDFESSKLGDLIMVSMTATAVKIDKIVTPLPTLQTDLDIAAENERNERKKKENQARLDYLKSHAGSFDFNLFITTIEEFPTTKELVDYTKKIAAERPEFFSEELLNKLDGYVRMEKMYGRGSGNKSTIKLLKEYWKID